MRWTSARSRTMSFLAPALSGRVGLTIARYRGEFCTTPGRGVITVDGHEVAAFGTAEYWRAHQNRRRELQAQGLGYDQARDQLQAEGVLGFWDFERAVETYPDFSIEAALVCPDPIIRALAMLDRRLGKRRLNTLELTSDLPFVRALYGLRCSAETMHHQPLASAQVDLIE